MPATDGLENRVVLVTGAARRVGAEIVRALHRCGARVAIHYRSSVVDAESLAEELSEQRDSSAAIFAADLLTPSAPQDLVDDVVSWGGSLDVLINNASSFYATPLGSVTQSHWDDLIGSNLKAPLFLSQSAAPYLRRTSGSIVNIVDIHAQRPLKEHVVYSAAKAGLQMLTRSLARELAPEVRVNGIAPGAILWPESGMTDEIKQTIVDEIPLRRPGEPADIADCVVYLARDAKYVTGQIVAVDGGRSLSW